MATSREWQGGNRHRVAVIPGDGIGKEVIPEAVKVLHAATAARPLAFTEFDWGADRFLRDGTVRREYTDAESSHMYIDNLVLQMVRDPSQFQVIVTCNLFGDIASDLGAQLIGGLGLAPSGNIHPGQVSLFEPVHGSAPAIAGKNIANPMGSILAAAMLLTHLGRMAEAQVIEEAVRAAIREGQTTVDLGGKMGTLEVGEWIARRVESRSPTLA